MGKYVRNAKLGVSRPRNAYSSFCSHAKRHGVHPKMKTRIRGKTISFERGSCSAKWSGQFMTDAEKEPFYQDAAKQKAFNKAMPLCSFTSLRQPPVQELRAEALGRENDTDNEPEVHDDANRFVGEARPEPVQMAHISNRLEVMEALGEGGYGLVRRVTDRYTGVSYACKFQQPEASCPEATGESIITEDEYLRRSAHPHVIRTFGLVSRPNNSTTGVGLLMELAEGCFVHHCRESLPPVIKSWGYVHQILQGLSYIHSNRILHVDLKPHNVLVCRASDGSAILKISDFGLAVKLPGDQLGVMLPGREVCTQNYRPPAAMIAGSSKVWVTASTDVFAMGCLAFFAFSGGHSLLKENYKEHVLAASAAGRVQKLLDEKIALRSKQCLRPDHEHSQQSQITFVSKCVRATCRQRETVPALLVRCQLALENLVRA
ncbi:aak-1 [Symbiodinium sp. CCMP2592]|nr:aak-1 [Symbiodinium sp. CCMP2592]